ncbi:hypothetical protein G6F40_015795 [Rhizopus arrhizus]|nr:hypothetical protein G6F40_015795 [Rhizopus arrhizus]
MCLYDGVGSSSEYLGVTVRDAGPRPPGGDGFSVWHPDAAGDESERVDFDHRTAPGQAAQARPAGVLRARAVDSAHAAVPFQQQATGRLYRRTEG